MKVLVYAIAIDTLIELPRIMGPSQTQVLLRPEFLMKLEVINWTYSIGCFSRAVFHKEAIEHFINQVQFGILALMIQLFTIYQY
jgi:hypothetical protein